jgi:hypothetical protein
MPIFKKRVSKNSPKASNTVFDIHPHEGPGWNKPKERVSLRRHLYRRHPVFTSVGALAVILVIALTADTFLGHANTVYWYPQSCLGGWTNFANAAGAPELSPLATANEFTADNSAILDNSISQIFCGEFGGDVPEGSAPLTAVLNISWTFKADPGPGGITQSDPSEDATSIPTTTIDEASSTPVDTVDETSPADEISPEPTAEPDPVSVPTEPEAGLEPASPPDPIEAQPEPTPATTPDPAPEPSSVPAENSGPAAWLFNLIRPAFAQEATTTPEVIVPEATTPEAPIPDTIVDDVASSSPGEVLGASSSTDELPPADEMAPTEEVPPADETTPAEEVAPADDAPPADNAPLEDRNMLTVRYSMNDEPWLILGIVGESSWQNAHFDIPLTSWEDLSSLQISFTSISVSDIAPVVYLDGLSLAVDYESADGLVLEDQLMIENPEILAEMPLPPPLEERQVAEILKIDENAKHSCAAEPFRIDISGLASTTANIVLRKDGAGLEEVGIGYLPQGIDVVFAGSGGYIYHPKTDETSLGLEIKNGAGSQKGDFNIPIIYTHKGVKNSSVICQINMINR